MIKMGYDGFIGQGTLVIYWILNTFTYKQNLNSFLLRITKKLAITTTGYWRSMSYFN